MNDIAKGIASLGICAVGAVLVTTGSPIEGVVVVILGFIFIWE